MPRPILNHLEDRNYYKDQIGNSVSTNSLVCIIFNMSKQNVTGDGFRVLWGGSFICPLFLR